MKSYTVTWTISGLYAESPRRAAELALQSIVHEGAEEFDVFEEGENSCGIPETIYLSDEDQEES